MERKYFTVAQANRSLILVKPIVRDIILKRKKMIAIKKSLKTAQLEERTADVEVAIKKLARQLKSVSKSITYHLEELEQIGCYLKDFELGIIDFPSILKGRVVFLCWMFDEEKVAHWHELTKSFAERQLVTAEFTALTLKVRKETHS